MSIRVAESTTKQVQYVFTETQDWFSFNEDAWRKLFPLVTNSAPRALEIGSWEGRSAVFILNELCSKGGSIVCIDHFDLFQTEAGRKRHATVLQNLSLTKKTFRVMEAFSFPALMRLLEEEMTVETPGYDWIYIDGSHESDDTFLDAELAWRLTRRGAIFIFDDYNWNKEPEDSMHHPKRGIDTFMRLHQGEFDVLSSPAQYQMILRKTTEMRIGFLIPGVEVIQPLRAFGYHMHIALTIDSSYAMPAAVAIRSAIKHTSGRMSFYVVDLGLTAEDRGKLQQLVAGFSEVTLVFLSSTREDHLARRGATWAKISMLQCLPVERVLYLDADILVRQDLRVLWDTDLQKKPLGAVVDVGYPIGHPGVARGCYFNAGVLLLDLAMVRADLIRLVELADELQHSTYKDQDALNTHFRDNWHSLDLKWNAQGLGTYAEGPCPDRVSLPLDDMKDPYIVHFTGPVNPSLPEVLNPFVQPCTAKPWGYAGAPGHPFTEEWWNALDETPWRGWRGSIEHSLYVSTMRESSIKAAVEALHECTNLVKASGSV